jgi:alpha-beta hydrolase superfamily lysophospholipase
VAEEAAVSAAETAARVAAADGTELAVRWATPSAKSSAPSAAAGSLAILYLHGLGSSQGGDKATWFRARAVAHGFAFCSFDARGHGDSGGAVHDLTLSRALDDAGAVLDWLAARWDGRVAFFASSMGAAVALWLAARRQPHFAAGVAIAPALGMERSLRDACGAEGLRRWQQSGRLPIANELGEIELGWELMEDLPRYPPGGLAPRYRTPTLVFQGLLDDRVPWRTATDFATGCAASSGVSTEAAEVEVHLFAGGDHRLLAYRERMWHLAAGFLERLAAASQLPP